MTDEQIVNSFLPDPKARQELLTDIRERSDMTLCFIHPDDAKGWGWVSDYVLAKQELSNTETDQGII
jgi:hypothetical protein